MLPEALAVQQQHLSEKQAARFQVFYRFAFKKIQIFICQVNISKIAYAKFLIIKFIWIEYKNYSTFVLDKLL